MRNKPNCYNEMDLKYAYYLLKKSENQINDTLYEKYFNKSKKKN